MPPFNMPLAFSIYMVIYLLFHVVRNDVDGKTIVPLDFVLLIIGIVTVTWHFAK